MTTYHLTPANPPLSSPHPLPSPNDSPMYFLPSVYSAGNKMCADRILRELWWSECGEERREKRERNGEKSEGSREGGREGGIKNVCEYMEMYHTSGMVCVCVCVCVCV